MAVPDNSVLYLPVGALLTTLLRHISTINGFDNLMAQPLLSDEPLTA
ncbi:TPA: hypothetical protein ACIX07_004606, partial [Escherichia coli]